MYTAGVQKQFRRLASILLPVLATQLALHGMSFFDVVMSGHASPEDLAGVAIGSNLWLPVYTGLTGVMMAVTPLVAHLIGGGRNDQVAKTVDQGMYLAMAIAGIVLMAGVLAVDPLLATMNLEPAVGQIARQYLIGIAWGIPPLFVYTVLRAFFDGLGQTRITLLITLGSLPINVLLNYLLIFGHGGFPRLGGAGAGYATAVTYGCMAVIAVAMARRGFFASYGVARRFYPLSLPAWREQLRIGLPIGGAIFIETSIFAAISLLMSRFDTVAIAAHQAALNFVTILYMVPLSMSMAMTILVGYEAGAQRFAEARRYAGLGLLLAVGFSLLGGTLLFLLNKQVAAFYSPDPAVAAMIGHFLIYAIFFQLSDAVATPVQGILRGYKDVNVTLVVTVVAYWLVGLPLGHWLAGMPAWGPFGYWVGLITGLGLGALLLLLRLFSLQRRWQEGISEGGSNGRS
ncbi:MATE family efflux transporter [Heliophilum fasciatum]|uniref:MATE family efflux transporter n=1 Tax=Heliophilum fasciatum TaxID=35700 RepID=UPI001FA9C170|nr:MATE family efflux transporter [Heliophilum fasciatum]MCW2276853.1 MATE family multidrug resistance protein [Heliophilum fasciatum]